MPTTRKSRFILLIVASLALGGCIFDSDDDDRPSSGEDDGNGDSVTPPPHDDIVDIFEGGLRTFATGTINDIEDNVEHDIISGFFVNYPLPVVDTTDDEVNNDDEDDLLFDLDSNDWHEASQTWKSNQTAPIEDPSKQRNYFLLGSDGWQENISSNKSDFHFIDEDFIREFHLGVARDWYFPKIDIDIVLDGETHSFNGEIDGRDFTDWSAWLISLGFPEHAKNFEWAIENEFIDGEEFSDGAEVIGVQRWHVATRYQVEQSSLQKDSYTYKTVTDDPVSNFTELNGKNGSYNDTDEGMSFNLKFSIAAAIPGCISSTTPLGAVQIKSGAVTESSNLTPQCENNTLVLMLNLTHEQKKVLGFYDPFDLFLAKMEIDGKVLIYMGKRYNKTTDSNKDEIPFEVFYNDIAVQDIQNTFKSWRDQDHEENGDD